MARINLLFGFNILVCFLHLASFVWSACLVKDGKTLFILGLAVWGLFTLIAITVVMLIYMNVRVVMVREADRALASPKKIMRKAAALLVPHVVVCCAAFFASIFRVLESPEAIGAYLYFGGLFMLIRSNMITLAKIYSDKENAWP